MISCYLEPQGRKATLEVLGFWGGLGTLHCQGFLLALVRAFTRDLKYGPLFWTWFMLEWVSKDSELEAHTRGALDLFFSPA